MEALLDRLDPYLGVVTFVFGAIMIGLIAVIAFA